ncbi:hypothetical protein S83_035963, partial [Arachis hypogaea]
LDFGIGNEFGKWMRLQGFVSGANARSLWGDRFPFPELADKVAQYLDDVRLQKDVGKEAVGKYLQ